MTLDEARRNLGARVVYMGGARPEYGVIESVNEWLVFVRYFGSGVKATYPADLAFSVPGDAS